MQTSIELNQLSPDEQHWLARKAKTSYIYVLQMASGIRTPSLKMADRLITYEPRLTIKTLLAPKLRRDAGLNKRPK